MAAPCIYCGLPAASDEHVISGAVGCKEILRDVVCEACNNTYGHTFEAKFVNGLALFLNFFQIRNERGVVPSVDLEGKIGDQRIKLVMTGDGKVLIPPKQLRSESTSSGHEKEFKIFDKRQETRIASNLRSRHQGLTWKRLDTSDGKEIIDVQAAFDADFLRSAEAQRSVAKYGLNLLIHHFGYEWVKPTFPHLVAYIKGEESLTRVGVCWEQGLLKRFPFEPPKHEYVVVCDARTRTATVFLNLFCLFPYCVVTQESGILVDQSRDGAIDPYNGRITPLFLGGPPEILNTQGLPPFPAPEYEFAERLRGLELGTLKQVIPAARNAIEFVQAVYAGRPGMPHICYQCRKVLRELTDVCPHCGKSPLPEQIASAAEEP